MATSDEWETDSSDEGISEDEDNQYSTKVANQEIINSLEPKLSSGNVAEVDEYYSDSSDEEVI